MINKVGLGASETSIIKLPLIISCLLSVVPKFEVGPCSPIRAVLEPPISSMISERVVKLFVFEVFLDCESEAQLMLGI